MLVLPSVDNVGKCAKLLKLKAQMSGNSLDSVTLILMASYCSLSMIFI